MAVTSTPHLISFLTMISMVRNYICAWHYRLYLSRLLKLEYQHFWRSTFVILLNLTCLSPLMSMNVILLLETQLPKWRKYIRFVIHERQSFRKYSMVSFKKLDCPWYWISMVEFSSARKWAVSRKHQDWIFWMEILSQLQPS